MVNSMKILMTAAIALTLAGCAKPVWYHPTKTQADFDRDAAQCQYEAIAATANIVGGSAAGMQQGFARAEVAQACMRARGYKQGR